MTETDLSEPAAHAAALRTGMGTAARIGPRNFSVESWGEAVWTRHWVL